MIKKKNRMIKKKIVLPKDVMVIHNWGGHLHTPPEDCEKIDKAFKHKSLLWLDLSICHECSIINECKRRKEYLKSLKN